MNNVVESIEVAEKKKKTENIDKSVDVSDDLVKTLEQKPQWNKKHSEWTTIKKEASVDTLQHSTPSLQEKEVKKTEIKQEKPTSIIEKKIVNSKEPERPENVPTEIKVGRIDENKITPSKESKPTSFEEKKVVVKTEKKATNLSKDPAQWVMGSVTWIVWGTAAAVSRLPAKVMDIVADPLQLFTKQFWKDSWFNTKKSLKNTWKTLTSWFRKNDSYETVNTQQSYAKSRGWNATKGDPWYKKLIKRPLWLAGKAVKVPARWAQTVLNFVGDTFNGIKKKKRKWNPLKWTWNPKKRTAKDFDYSRTKRSWEKLTTRDVKKEKKKK